MGRRTISALCPEKVRALQSLSALLLGFPTAFETTANFYNPGTQVEVSQVTQFCWIYCLQARVLISFLLNLQLQNSVNIERYLYTPMYVCILNRY